MPSLVYADCRNSEGKIYKSILCCLIFICLTAGRGKINGENGRRLQEAR